MLNPRQRRNVGVQYPPVLCHIPLMARPTYYVPAISRPVVAALYHEARRHRLPMTRFLDQLLKGSLQGTPGWHQASQDWPELNKALPPTPTADRPTS